MKRVMTVALGSGLGGGLRFLVERGAPLLGLSFLPLTTLLVNVGGSLLIGYLAGRWAMGGTPAGTSRKWDFWVSGFCGGFTTFSAFSWQILELIASGEGTLAGIYAALSIGLGWIAVWFGLSLALQRRQPIASADDDN
jgi:CrcB protein